MKPLLDDRFADQINSYSIHWQSNLLGFADFGGEHKQSTFETYSFLFSGGADLQRWLDWQAEFRTYSKIAGRRMSYKSLNDKLRKQALGPFLNAAQDLNGVLFNVAILKGNSVLFEATEEPRIQLAYEGWKPKVADKVAKVIAIGAYFAASQCMPNQNIYIFLDEDSALANIEQHKTLTDLFGGQVLAHVKHNLGHFKLGSTKSDNGSLQIEDTVAIADLAAGALADLLQNLAFHKIDGKIAAFFNPTNELKCKTTVIGNWLVNSATALKIVNMVILPGNENGFHLLLIDEELKLFLDLASTFDRGKTSP